jgi:hypothetical protein
MQHVINNANWQWNLVEIPRYLPICVEEIAEIEYQFRACGNWLWTSKHKIFLPIN